MKTVELKSRFPMIISQMPLRVGAATREGARLIANTARARAPIGGITEGYDPHPGRLRESIHVADWRDAGDSDAKWAVVVDPVDQAGRPYASYVEFGSVHNEPPHPFLIPAYEEARAITIAMARSSLIKL